MKIIETIGYHISMYIILIGAGSAISLVLGMSVIKIKALWIVLLIPMCILMMLDIVNLIMEGKR